ncbi:hypothetical protein LL965_11830 [Xanthomonas cassavae CFBP 4642]|uniref:Uncharacterized protein n=1 Tax=Xanthomonas cassavae CFBP 4642 TaxID=1219375 RepID=A0ABS8HEZ7_9XANT|nr:hypothetical protein [Xanthomonas cassavae CFBP 4642]
MASDAKPHSVASDCNITFMYFIIRQFKINKNSKIFTVFEKIDKISRALQRLAAMFLITFKFYFYAPEFFASHPPIEQ